MTEIIAWALFVCLSAIAALHLLWATGSTWPLRDEREFARTLIGVDAERGLPGPALTALVAALIAAAGLCALWVAQLLAPPLPGAWRDASPRVLTAVFLLRGLSTYALPKLPRTEPFRRLDRAYFAPLCLLLGGGFLWLALAVG